MKRAISILTLVAMLLTNATLGFAGNPEVVNITITITHSKSIVIGGSADITISPGNTAISSSAVTVKNDGTGVDETVALSTTVPAGWTVNFQFAATQPTVGDANWKVAADISEVLVYDETKNLWIKIVAPATTTDESLTVPVTVTAG